MIRRATRWPLLVGLLPVSFLISSTISFSYWLMTMNRRIMLRLLAVISITALMACSSPTEVKEIGEVEDASIDDTDDDSNSDSEQEELDEMLEEVVEGSKMPSLTAIVFGSEGVIAEGVVGVRKAGDDREVEIDDPYHIGSCTKPMTAALATTLVEDGQVSWETTVVDVFDDFADDIHDDYRDVTLVELLTHRAGLTGALPTDFSDLWNYLWENQTDLPTVRAEAAERLLTQEPAHPSGQEVYSNAGFIVAGAMLEASADASWEELMEQRVFEPLDMGSCGFGAAGNSSGEIDAPWGHVDDGGELVPVAPGPTADNPGAFGPAGRVHCSMRDWANFNRVYLELEPDYLDGEDLGFPDDLSATPDDHSILAWSAVDRGWAQGMALSHSGSNTMNYAVVWLAPNRQVGIQVATNAAYGDAAADLDDVVASLIDEFL